MGKYLFVFRGGAQWAKIKVYSTLIKLIYENGEIYEQDIDQTVIPGPIIKQKKAEH